MAISSPKLRVLLVDGNHQIPEVTSYLLEHYGYEIRIARDGAGALEFATEFAPHAVFLSLELPDVDAVDIAQRLRQLPATSGTTLIGMVSNQEPDPRAPGFDEFIRKPVNIDEVLVALRRIGAPPAGSGPIAAQ